MQSERQLLAPDSLVEPIGFAHGIATHGGKIVWLAGQNGTDALGAIPEPDDLVAQTDLALTNVIKVVEEAGGKASDIVKLNFYVSDVAAYRGSRRELGAVWRKHFGRYYPAMMLLGVTGFYEPEALVEIDGYAVIDEAGADSGAGPGDGPGAGPGAGPGVGPGVATGTEPSVASGAGSSVSAGAGSEAESGASPSSEHRE
jgi:enamine deaminase RidA (YjgF/YER057c/UK114 family)